MKIINILKKNKLLTLVGLIYLVLLVLVPQKASQAGKHSLYYIKEMLTIMPVIFILTSLIETWIPKEVIMNGFGEKSGIKGGVLSFLLGSLSAGPIYAAFPVCKMLLKKGASAFNITIILSAWAVVKVPMLINEAKFLGGMFMGIRWLLTSIIIFIMAYLVSKIVNKSDLTIKEECDEDTNYIKIKKEYCIGCGLCTKLCPNNFKMKNGKAVVISQYLKGITMEELEKVAEKCPAKVISI